MFLQKNEENLKIIQKLLQEKKQKKNQPSPVERVQTKKQMWYQNKKKKTKKLNSDLQLPQEEVKDAKQIPKLQLKIN